MTSPPIEPPAEDPRRRGPWLLVAVLAVALLLLAGGALLLRGGDSPSLAMPTPPTAPSSSGQTNDEPGTNSPQPTPFAVTGTFIEPGDGRAPLLDEIEAARQSIDLEVYIITDEIILDSLEDARRRGIDVRVILEEHPFGGSGGQDAVFARLEDAGIAVRWGNPVFRFNQVKMTFVDGPPPLVAFVAGESQQERIVYITTCWGISGPPRTSRPVASRGRAATSSASAIRWRPT